jgi:2-polyprenyl-3-methyl-5-hydroxy-6-metoxy-1,4-benzoquinol methylase
MQSQHDLTYDFNKSNPLGGKGERVDITYHSHIDFEQLDMYQKSHYKRYEFAKKCISPGAICGDFACGTGYGSVMLADVASQVIGADINDEVVQQVKKRYAHLPKVNFLTVDLLELSYKTIFDAIVSFETLEHFEEKNILILMKMYNQWLKPGGIVIFSTPYMQEASEAAINMGFHLTFYIDENKINHWLNQTGFVAESFYYQNYQSHTLENNLVDKDFVICVARKKD